jgi:hypothetical protein
VIGFIISVLTLIAMAVMAQRFMQATHAVIVVACRLDHGHGGAVNRLLPCWCKCHRAAPDSA